MTIEIRPFGDGDRAWAREVLLERWGSLRVVTRGEVHWPDRLQGLVAEGDGQRLGLLTYRVDDQGLEVVTLDAFQARQGVGRALLEAAVEIARAHGAARLWLVTTNDNGPAQRFYEAFGMRKVAVHQGAVDAARRLKPEIPATGVDGVPITDEIEYDTL